MAGQGVVTSSSTIDSIMDCESLPAVADNVLRPVANLLEADSAVFLRFRHDSLGRPFICESSYAGRHPDSLDQYVSGYFVEDPVIKPLIDRSEEWRRISGPVRFHLSHQVKLRALRRSHYFRNFLEPHDLGDIIGIAFPFDCDGPQMLCLGIHRSAGRPDFGEPQELALDAVVRPLRMVLESLCLRSSIAEQSALIQALDDTGSGVEFAVFDRHLHMLRGSQRLRSLFAATCGDTGAARKVRRCAALLQRRSTADGVGRTDITLPGGLAGELRLVHDRRGQHYVLILRDTGGSAPRTQLSEALPVGEKLTPREQQVIAQVARGGSNARIAENLGISVRTVENHLRAVYDKLDINSRTQLISLLFSA